MFLVDAAGFGATCYGRMVRDGVVVPATGRYGLPLDIVATPGLRACCVAPSVPAHTVLSGAAGWWVRHGGAWPGHVTVVGQRGLHRGVPVPESSPVSDRVTFHSGLAWRDGGLKIGPVAVASDTRCCVDAMRWDSHQGVIPMVVDAVATGKVTLAGLRAEVRRDDARGSGYARLRELWRELDPVLHSLDSVRK
ncbi:hypothetical protein [Demequina aurantiaca]|uniref:hypothetical protein n=1 Tax=Demequina aurantiaca TaxID=676200 RepID=UPI000AFA1BE0|nr:hypothetical protein [Demequina aurantiaca]